MITKVKNYISKYNLLPSNTKVVLAFSYGVDSRVLLDVLLNLNYEVVLAHVNHMHREESIMEEEETKKLAKEYNLKVYIHHLNEDKSNNFHDDAHNKRYTFFKDVAKKEDTRYIITAHHMDDNIETVLMNITKGSNLYGYSGISNKLFIDDYIIVRPFLCVSKEEIINYSSLNNIKYYEDSSNSENYFTRNRIRHNVIPILKQENSKLLENVNHYSSILKEAFEYIRSESIEYITLWQNRIDIKKYITLNIALRRDIISYYLEENNIEKNYRIIESIDNILLDSNPQADISLSDNSIFKKRYDYAVIELKTNKEDEYYELWENSVINTKNLRVYFTKNSPTLGAKYIKLCYNDLVYPLILRTRKDGDRINMTYGHKKIKDLMMDLHIPKEERDSTLLLLNNETILFVVDYAKSKELIEMKDKGDIYLVYEVRNEK